MPLLELPVELLEQVIYHTMPLGFESFMVTCKTVHAAGSQLIPGHNQRRRDWEQVDVGHGHDLDCSAKLLRQIIRDPLIADYVETAGFSYNGTFERPSWEDREEYTRLEHDDGRLVTQVLARSKILQEQKISPSDFSFVTHIEARNKRPFPGAVVEVSHSQVAMQRSDAYVTCRLLDNVSKLVLPDRWLTPDDGVSAAYLETLALIASRNGQKLSKLSKLESRGMNASLQDLQPFLVLPKLHHIITCAGHVAVVDTTHPNLDMRIDKPFDWKFLGLSSQLRKLELMKCCVSGIELDKLLPHTPKLQAFNLCYFRFPADHFWDVKSVVQALQDHCSQPMTEVSIRVDVMPEETKACLRDFSAFISLETLELDLRFFLGLPEADDILDQSRLADRAEASVLAWDHGFSSRLIDMLPPTIKKVQLLSGDHPGEVAMVQTLFSGWHILSANTTLPVLEEVIVVRGKGTIDHQANVETMRESDIEEWILPRELIEAAGCLYVEPPYAKAEWVEKWTQSTNA